ncbi:ankyrin repeat and SAM domain-containing protein 3 isoform X4 [Cervus canadensis]|uniref:ankyrin repeat and SAM domain-containing protein 3 isoform X4 n=1 Tax=Cervus canadensis TaxID=1574408 RepID=UPI001CA35BB6|nr:ankyrin repeat and SAM domain-containing protein 3 isoform X4 [Cervus canadensis]
MSELSDEASEPELLDRSLSMWHGLGTQVSREELAVPLDLHTAASIGQYEVVKECVQRRELDLNKKNGGGWTPLMYASYIGHDTIVHLLLEAGVSVNVPTPEGQTPLMLASSCGNESIAYFLLQQGAELEMKDIQGWTALFHCTSAGHQQMVKFLLDSGANANVREPVYGFTPLMEAAAAGHEIIVQYFLNHGVRVDTRDHSGATARMLARQYGHMKIVGLIDAHSPSLPKSLYRGPEQVPPRGYVSFNSSDEHPLEGGGLCYRDVTSPINERDVESSSSSSREEQAFSANPGVVRSSSSEGLARAPGLSSEASLESNEDSDHVRRSSVRKQTKSYVKTKNRYSSSDSQWAPSAATSCAPGASPQTDRPPYSGPQDLATLLEQIGCLKYLQVFEEQDVDLRIFLTLTESDLKEIGITLFGPKRKMTSAIARWHSSARPPSDALELAYADRLEAEMQELAIQLHKRCEEVEAMRGLVSQEQELRAVVESCLLEQDGARKDVHAQLQETWALAKDATLVLDQLRACQAELSARVRRDESLREAPLSPGLPAAGREGGIPAVGRTDGVGRLPGRVSPPVSVCLSCGRLPGPLTLHTHVLTVSPGGPRLPATSKTPQPSRLALAHSALGRAPTGHQHFASQVGREHADTAGTCGSRGPVLSQWLRPPGTHTHPALCSTDPKGWQASLQALSLPELSGALEERVREMGRVLCSVTQSLEKLQALSGKESWREP